MGRIDPDPSADDDQAVVDTKNDLVHGLLAWQQRSVGQRMRACVPFVVGSVVAGTNGNGTWMGTELDRVCQRVNQVTLWDLIGAAPPAHGRDAKIH